MPRGNRCMYIVHVCFDVCCSEDVGVCGNVCCEVAVVKDSVGLLTYVVCLCKGCDGCCVLCFYSDAWSCMCFCMGSMSISSCICCMCASCGSSQCFILHDLQFVNASRACKRRPY